ncbi:hypothetical protein DPEC_G00350010 [Dallia pectoralis]|uniref:Uncharacterized protein n=1 Tax=Dallia pectoralis TaxID=75939 RepID=A0ACC2F1F5_DALPE|nr:hypothetical protein DPEC_G00350010 [Dallia pectoralis]
MAGSLGHCGACRHPAPQILGIRIISPRKSVPDRWRKDMAASHGCASTRGGWGLPIPSVLSVARLPPKKRTQCACLSACLWGKLHVLIICEMVRQAEQSDSSSKLHSHAAQPRPMDSLSWLIKNRVDLLQGCKNKDELWKGLDPGVSCILGDRK